jgi:excisionase family DNA binding protein
MSALLTIKESSKLLGVSTKTLRRWEKEGKIESMRTVGGHRRFTAETIQQVKNNKYQPVRTVSVPPREIIKVIGQPFPSTPQEASVLNLFNLKLISFVLVSSLLIFIANYPLEIGYLVNKLTGISIPSIPEEKLVSVPEGDWLSVLSAQGGMYEGDVGIAGGVDITGSLDVSSVTTTEDLVVSSSASIYSLSVTSGLVVSGNEIINSSGKIPALNGDYFESLSGENIINVDAHHLNGVAASSFLRSDQSDTAEGAINFTASPGNADISGGSVYINPASTTSDYTLLGIAVGGTQKFKIDAEGDIITEGSLSVAGISILTGNVTFSGRGLFSHGASQGLNLPTNVGVPSVQIPNQQEGDVVYDTSGDTLYIYDGSSFTAIKGLFTDGGSTTYLTSTTDNLALGGIDSSAPFFMNVSTGNLTITEGLTAGSGSVGIIDSSGKIPAISSTYLANLSGANLTSVNATALDSTDSTSFLRSDTSDGFTSGTLSFSDGTFLDLSSILHNDIALQGLRLPQNTSFSVPTSGEGFIAWDTDDKKLFVYNSSSWTEIGGGLFTDGGNTTYLTSQTDDFALGGTESSAPLFFNESAELLTLTNTTAGDSFRVNDVASDTTPFLIDNDGKVGIGMTNPGHELDVSGSINFTGALREDGVEILSGMIAPFAGSCPSGWTEYTAARGRYVVGVPSGGTVAGTQGTALTNLENRAVGQHNHGITDPGHTHTHRQYTGNCCSTGGVAADPDSTWGNTTEYIYSATTGITINNAGSVAGTNAPYIQLRYCQKSAGSDLAEWIPSDEDLAKEAIVSIDPDNREKVIASRREYDSTVIGIIASQPGWLIGTESEDNVQMALAGRVPVKVTLKNGEIKPGDPITTSAIPGVGMLATKEGSIVGKAMETLDETSSLSSCFDEGTEKEEFCGTIMVFVNISWYNPDVYLADTGNLNIEEVAGTTDYILQAETEDENLSMIENSLDSLDTEQETASMSARMDSLETEMLLLQSSFDLTSPTESTNSSFLTSLTVLGDSVLGDTVINGRLDIGILSFDNLTGSIDAIGPLKLQSLALAPIEFVGGAIEMDQDGNLDIKKGQIHGNDTFRGKITLNAGETEIKVEKDWEEAPYTIVVTPSYTVAVSTADIDKNGFTIKVKDPSDEEEELHWLAIW